MWCMKNYGGDLNHLHAMILNINEHYKVGHHLGCNLESLCRQPGYHSRGSFSLRLMPSSMHMRVD